jgi:hypothetical protein
VKSNQVFYFESKNSLKKEKKKFNEADEITQA